MNFVMKTTANNLVYFSPDLILGWINKADLNILYINPPIK